MGAHIVVGVDGSAHGNAALRWALGHAEVVDGEVTAVFAWQLPLIGVPGAFDRDEMEETAKRFLVETMSAVEPTPKVPLWPFVAQGDPTESLLEAAGRGADLLVVGTRGRGRFAGLLLGSVCQGCAANAPCPVVVVKTTDVSSSPPPAGEGGSPTEGSHV